MIMDTKGQYVAILLTIIIGILIYIAMSMAANNLKTTLDTYYEEYNFSDFFITVHAIPEGALQKIENLDGVVSLEGRVTATVPFISENEKERVNVRLISTRPGEKINKAFLKEGAFIKDKYNEVMVLSQFAEARGILPGDEISLQFSGKTLKLKVAGLVANPEFIYLMETPDALMTDPSKYGVVYMSLELAQSLLGMTGLYNDILVDYDDSLIPNVDNQSKIDTVIDDIEKVVEGYGIQSIVHKKDQLSNLMISQEITQLKKTSSSLPMVFLLVAALILTMMLNRMVKKDRGIIGLLKAIGYSNREVVFHYTKYALIAGILGGGLGGLAGMATAGGMTKMYLYYFNIPLLRVDFNGLYVVMAILLAAVVCTAAGLFGARGILHITPAQSMVEEAPKQGKRIFIERMPKVWKRFPFSWKMVSKNIFRNKKRTSLVVAGIIFTYGMMLFTLTMPAVVDDIMNKYFTDFLKMDYSVNFKMPLDKKALYDFKSLGEIETVEEKAEIPVEISNGNFKKSLVLLGIPMDTEFYGFEDENGRTVTMPARGLVLSENLANILKVGKGDRVQIKPYSGEDPVYEPVIFVVPQSLGLGAYYNIETLDKKLLGKNLITGVNIKSDDSDLAKELLKAENIGSVSSSQDLRAMYDEYLAMIIISIVFMLIFSGILGVSIVYNVTTVNIAEREIEFSTLRVLGFSNNDIFRLILKENNLITLAGIFLGIPAGEAMLKYATMAFSTENYSLNMEPTLTSMVFAGMATVVFVVLAQSATYRKIKKLDFLQALKTRI